MLELRDVSFAYNNGVPVLEHLNIQVREGEFIGLGGRNGSGKTTVTRLFMGLEKPTGGFVYIDGRDVTEEKAARRSRSIGYVFQRPERQMFRPTVAKEIAYGPEQSGHAAADVKIAVETAMAATGLAGLADAYPPNLNRSEKQRVAIASALAMKTRYIILDEPTSGQDNADKKMLMELLKALNKRGITILLITHDMDILAEYCSRVIVIGNRTKAFDGGPEELFTKRDDLYELGLSRPVSVTLSMAVPGLPYCPTMAAFREALLSHAGGNKIC